MSPFDDDLIINRLFDKLDNLETKIDERANKLEEKVDDLCNRVTTIEVTSATINSIAKSAVERKEKIFYVTLGLTGGIVSIIQVVSSGIIG